MQHFLSIQSFVYKKIKNFFDVQKTNLIFLVAVVVCNSCTLLDKTNKKDKCKKTAES